MATDAREVTWASHMSTDKLRRLYTRYLRRAWRWRDRVDDTSDYDRRVFPGTYKNRSAWADAYRTRVQKIQAELKSRGEIH